jgi:hypothetical protein
VDQPARRAGLPPCRWKIYDQLPDRIKPGYADDLVLLAVHCTPEDADEPPRSRVDGLDSRYHAGDTARLITV